MNALAIIVDGALIASALMIVGRWEIAVSFNVEHVFRLDRWTGEVARCKPMLASLYSPQAGDRIECER